MALAQDESTLPIVEEQVAIEKTTGVTGRVKIQSRVRMVDETVQADLSVEEIEITRVACDRIVESAPAIRSEGDVTIISVVEEILIVEKRLLLKEELHVRKRTVIETVEMPVSLKKLDVIVERDGAGAQPIPNSRRTTP